MDTTTMISSDGGGWYVEWYTDDDGASGFGDNAMVSRWYGSHEQCLARSRRRPPSRRHFTALGTGDVLDTCPCDVAARDTL